MFGKEKNENVRIVIKSWHDYQNHDLNVLRDCLNCWTKNTHLKPTFQFKTMCVDPDNEKNMYFVNTNVQQLIEHDLFESVVDNPDLEPTSYMCSDIEHDLYRPKEIA